MRASAVLITYLVVKATGAFGGGIKGGATFGILFAIRALVIGNLYWFFSVTFYAMDLWAIESVYQIVAGPFLISRRRKSSTTW